MRSLRRIPRCARLIQTRNSQLLLIWDTQTASLPPKFTQPVRTGFLVLAIKLKKSPTQKEEPVDIPHEVKEEIEEKQIQERVNIGAHVVHETIRREGEEH